MFTKRLCLGQLCGVGKEKDFQLTNRGVCYGVVSQKDPGRLHSGRCEVVEGYFSV